MNLFFFFKRQPSLIGLQWTLKTKTELFTGSQWPQGFFWVVVGKGCYCSYFRFCVSLIQQPRMKWPGQDNNRWLEGKNITCHSGGHFAQLSMLNSMGEPVGLWIDPLLLMILFLQSCASVPLRLLTNVTMLPIAFWVMWLTWRVQIPVWNDRSFNTRNQFLQLALVSLQYR